MFSFKSPVLTTWPGLEPGANLTLTNEKGTTVAGFFIGSDLIDAPAWGNLTATLVNGDTQINWGNGTVWTKVAVNPPPVAGTWMIGTQQTHIQQSGGILVITNENGSSAPGVLISGTQIDATGWGNLVGTLSNDNTRIDWANGTYWVRSFG